LIWRLLVVLAASGPWNFRFHPRSPVLDLAIIARLNSIESPTKADLPDMTTGDGLAA
jgi:hypothetical protein